MLIYPEEKSASYVQSHLALTSDEIREPKTDFKISVEISVYLPERDLINTENFDLSSRIKFLSIMSLRKMST